MLGAIYTGLSGMNAYTQGLQTISNNVANLNTAGFKSSTATFTDLFGQGGGLAFSGGDATQAGSGVRFATPRVDFQQGDLRQSDGDLDLAIQGNGFLVLKGEGGKTFYARTGQFTVDEDGFISLQGTKNHLAVLNANNEAVALNIDAKRISAPVASTKVKFADNLSTGSTEATVSNIVVHDSNGGKHTWQVKLKPVAGQAGTWDVSVTDQTGAVVGTTKQLKFLGSIPDPTTATLEFTSAPANANPLKVVLDFSSGVTSFSAGTTSTLRAASVDGNGVGALTTVTADENGQIKVAYSNGKTELLGAVVLAEFRDPQQLTRVGSGLFEASGRGQSRLVASGSDGVGKVLSRQQEASNVNLSQEFGDLILIQRGFQASSQVVSVANDMIQQLFGIRGQG